MKEEHYRKVIEKQEEYFKLAKKIIRAWHGMDNVQKEDEEMMWGIYERNSPEMKRLNQLESELAVLQSESKEDISRDCHELLGKKEKPGIADVDEFLSNRDNESGKGDGKSELREELIKFKESELREERGNYPALHADAIYAVGKYLLQK